jgi:hypothetical protein
MSSVVPQPNHQLAIQFRRQVSDTQYDNEFKSETSDNLLPFEALYTEKDSSIALPCPVEFETPMISPSSNVRFQLVRIPPKLSEELG